MSLTGELKRTDSPIRQFLDEHLPNTKRLLADYRLGAGRLLVPSSGANPGTVGTATDWLFRFLVYPHPDLRLAMAGARTVGVKAMAALMQLADRVEGLVLADGFGPGMYTPPQYQELEQEVLSRIARDLAAPLPSTAFPGPTAGSTIPPDLLLRACWALALLTEVFRGGHLVLERGPLARFAPRTAGGLVVDLPEVGVEDLLTLMPSSAIPELAALHEVLEDAILPALASRVGTWHLGPTFAGSVAIGGADADLIAAGLLVELKTTLGSKAADGRRVCAIDRTELYQVLGYAILDFKDRYRIDAVMVCNARYGYVASWPLGPLVEELSGGKMDLAGARESCASVLAEAQEVEPPSDGRSSGPAVAAEDIEHYPCPSCGAPKGLWLPRAGVSYGGVIICTECRAWHSFGHRITGGLRVGRRIS